MIEVYYESGSALGDKIRLDGAPYWMQTGDILNYKWKYISRNRRLKKFHRDITEHEIKISVLGTSREEYDEQWKRLHDVFERDVVNLKAGRLYFNGMYMSCYIVGSEKAEWERDSLRCENTFTIVTDAPYWVMETTQSVSKIEDVDEGLAYPYGYPYGYYASSETTREISTGHFGESDYELTIEGAATNPTVYVNGVAVGARVTLSDGERLVISTRGNKVYMIEQSGRRVDVFNERLKTGASMFGKVPPTFEVSWNGSFSFDITVYSERSEPQWN